MNKTAIFLLAIFSVSLLACVSTKSTNLKHKKFLTSNSNKKAISPAKGESNSSELNFTNLYPVIDESYNEAWKEAEDSGDDAKLNKYYLCQNLTLAKQIHEALHNNITEFYGILDKHRENLQNFRNGEVLFRVDNSQSNFELNVTNPEYDEYLGELSRTYQNNYMENITKIEQILEKNNNIARDLTTSCENYQNIPEKKTPEEQKVEDKKISPVAKSDKAVETFGFMEMRPKTKKKMTKKEKKVFLQLIQIHERVSKIINKFSA